MAPRGSRPDGAEGEELFLNQLLNTTSLLLWHTIQDPGEQIRCAALITETEALRPSLGKQSTPCALPKCTVPEGRMVCSAVFVFSQLAHQQSHNCGPSKIFKTPRDEHLAWVGSGRGRENSQENAGFAANCIGSRLSAGSFRKDDATTAAISSSGF